MDCDVEKVNISVGVGKGELDCGVESVEVIEELEEALKATNPKKENIIYKSPPKVWLDPVQIFSNLSSSHPMKMFA